jgi:hypothetical protein
MNSNPFQRCCDAKGTAASFTWTSPIAALGLISSAAITPEAINQGYRTMVSAILWYRSVEFPPVRRAVLAQVLVVFCANDCPRRQQPVEFVRTIDAQCGQVAMIVCDQSPGLQAVIVSQAVCSIGVGSRRAQSDSVPRRAVKSRRVKALYADRAITTAAAASMPRGPSL